MKRRAIGRRKTGSKEYLRGDREAEESRSKYERKILFPIFCFVFLEQRGGTESRASIRNHSHRRRSKHLKIVDLMTSKQGKFFTLLDPALVLGRVLVFDAMLQCSDWQVKAMVSMKTTNKGVCQGRHRHSEYLSYALSADHATSDCNRSCLDHPCQRIVVVNDLHRKRLWRRQAQDIH